ncbi:multicopper oxidase family protein [Hyphomicrobium sp. D-2]|uniref:multicopper oxidase family protein n=1 Tax=Hyphomicrobium sp. D-2 TaxID=3041621 RepID=UPI002458ECE8|nr:multicopper oxidase family protein [Hyphomicrobium sp. D-2]MDH4983958.1 multicopper oxidase family protein [Hyphomicrobium sp. D-2]
MTGRGMRYLIPVWIIGLLLTFGIFRAALKERPGTSLLPEVSAVGPEIAEPPSLRPVNGVLDVTLTAKPARVEVAGRTLLTNVYNDLYIPPVLRLRRGDELRLKFVNETGQSDLGVKHRQVSNVHYHGMAIPPVQPADDIYMLVPPAGGIVKHEHAHKHGDEGKHVDHTLGADIMATNSYDYRWTVPADHATGLFWYHPHPHGMSEAQVLGGMSGMLVIEDLIERLYPELHGLKRRTLILKDIALPGSDDDPKTKTINGVLGGVIHIAPGAFEIWEIGNLGADAYFDLAIDGHRFWLLEQDGNALDRPLEIDHVFLPPASRARVVVEAGNTGLYGLRTRAVDTGSAGDPNPEVLLATLNVGCGSPPGDAGSIRARLSQSAAGEGGRAARIAALPVTRSRTITYTESDDGKVFFIDGREFDINRIDVDVTLGDVEEWIIVNDTDERHTFHIHQLDFLVQSVAGNPLETAGMRDNVDVPFRNPKTRVPGVVKVKIPFTNPLIVGKFPFHCHILEHEDGGMMANVRVRPRD